MTKPLPPLGWIRSFEAASRHLSFTAAAEELGLTQSAISQQVKSLETRLGMALFVRHARGLALTDAGRRLVPEVEGPLQALAHAIDDMAAGPSDGLLTITASVSVTDWIIAPRLKDFTSRHPGLRLRLLGAIWPDDFHSARADVEIRFGSAKQASAGAELLLPNRLIAVKSPALHGTIQELPLIETVGTSVGWQTWSRQVEQVPAATVFADTYGMALHLACQQNGVALVSELLAQSALQTGLVQREHSASLASTEGYYMAAQTAKPEAREFCDWLRNIIENPV